MGSESGIASRMISIETDEPGEPRVAAYAYGFVNSILKDPHPEVDFGDVRLAGELPYRDVSFQEIGGRGLRVTGIVESPSYISAKVMEGGNSLRVGIKPTAPWGLHMGEKVVVSLDSRVQSKAAVWVSLNAFGEVTVSKNPFPLGVIRNNEKRDFNISLTSRSGHGFSVGKVETTGIPGSASVVACEPVSKGCKQIQLSIEKGARMGPVSGELKVEFPDSKSVLAVSLEGIVLPPGMDPVPDRDDSAASSSESNSSASGRELNIRNAIRSTVRQASTASPAGRGPLLKWSVANEGLVYGYIVLRGASKDGPFEVVSKETVKAEAFEPGIANAYQWRDTSAELGNTYWYEIVLLYRDGRKEVLTSPQKVLAK
jgi:hypothetical protein